MFGNTEKLFFGRKLEGELLVVTLINHALTLIMFSKGVHRLNLSLYPYL